MKKQKRRSPIAKSLLKNSISAYLSGIEIHNKPTFKYRYEVVVILTINAWELALKAYIYKHVKDFKIFNKDGTTKYFKECLECVRNKLGKAFMTTYENLGIMYLYRNKFAHFYVDDLEILIFSLLKKNTELYAKFIEKYFNISIGNVEDLVLLPIGFKKPFSPYDFISNETTLSKADPVIKEFVYSIVKSSQELHDNNIKESILIDFNVGLYSVRNLKNADIVASVNNAESKGLRFDVKKELKTASVVTNRHGSPVRIVSNKKDAEATLVYTEIEEGIFNEINNIIEANNLLARKEKKFIFGEQIYYRVYAERQFIKKEIDLIEMLVNASNKFYSPFLYWLNILPEDMFINYILDNIKTAKYPNIISTIRLIYILGNDYMKWYANRIAAEFRNIAQKPQYFYTAQKLSKRKRVKPVLEVLGYNKNSKIKTPWDDKEIKVIDLLSDLKKSESYLATSCIKVFEGDKTLKDICRKLDFVIYGRILSKKAESLSDLLNK